MESFAKRLQYLMDLKKINQQAVADGIGVNRSRVSLWLNQKTKDPRRETFQKLCDFFGCSIDWLAEGKGDPFPTYITAESSAGYNVQRKERREVNNTLDQILLEKFKMQCGSVYFDEFFEFIAENYGTSKEDVDHFFEELMKTHSNFRVWLEEKKQSSQDIYAGGQK